MASRALTLSQPSYDAGLVGLAAFGAVDSRNCRAGESPMAGAAFRPAQSAASRALATRFPASCCSEACGLGLASFTSMFAELVRPFQKYAPHQDVPLAGYAGLMATHVLLLGGVLHFVARRSHREPSRAELALLGVATHKLSRLLTKDAVTAPLRAPFSHRESQEGAGEVHDEPRGHGLQRIVGQLLTCPYCAGPWLGMGLSASLVWRPVQTRFVLRLLTAVTIADFLHLAYARLNEGRKKVQAERRLGDRR